MTIRLLPALSISVISAIIGGAIVLQFVPEPPPFSEERVSPVVLTKGQPAAIQPSPAFASAPAPAANHAIALPDFRSAAGQALDAVVHVRTAQSVTPSYGWYDWSGMFQRPAPYNMPSGSGSGVILSDDGYIVTNHHVIEGADLIEIGLNDNRTFAAELVGSDPTTDIAVLRIEAQDLKALEWGDSDAVQVGDWVLAVGNPFDLTSTVTAGIVSAKARDIQLLQPDFDRSLSPVESFIQTDAAVNPGNSGGALVSDRGALIGINTAIASRTGSYAGYAFAIPSSLAQKVARDLIEFGTVQRAFLGVNIQPVTEETAQRLELPAVSGVLVSGVTDDSGARAAGMQVGDVILSVSGTPTPTLPELLERVNRFRPGQSATVEVWRQKEVKTLSVELGSRESLLSQRQPEAPIEGDSPPLPIP
ncbi:MAG: trypsin-like peptidase domain-containing protein [Flavobacteriales bacterium]|nr:trypsin-like peptidase domain-containing protein [Flavobacteriales bacterium]